MQRLQLIFLLLGTLMSPYSFSGEIVTDSTVVRVANTNGNSDIFQVLTSGGTGPCVGTWIYFPRVEASTQSIHDRAYSTVMSALLSGKKVMIHNYKDNTCTKAAYIELRN